MPELILLRHARSKYKAGERIVQGSDPDPANTLDGVGRRQADKLGHMLDKRGVVPAAVWSSPLPRARQTCDIALAAMRCRLPVCEDPRLREMCKGSRGLPGGLEGRRSDEVKTPEYREQYRRAGWDFRHGSRESGGETAREKGTQFLAAMNAIADKLADDATGLVFAHGQAIRYGLGAELGFPDIQQLDKEYKLDNCEGLIVARDARKRWQLVGRIAIA